MRRVGLWALLGVALSVGVNKAAAQDARIFCEDGGPVECIDAAVEVVFPFGPVLDNSEFRYAEFVPGTAVESAVVLDLAAGPVAGWSYGVRHDPAVLMLREDSLTTDATVLEGVGAQILQLVGNGYVSVNVVDLGLPVDLPAGRHIVARATYTLIADAGTVGTRIELTEDLAPVGGAAVAIEVTEGGVAKQPRLLTDGVVRRVVVAAEDCANGVDDDGDGLVDNDDPDCRECPCPAIPDPECRDYALYFGSSPTVGDVDVRGESSFSISSRNAAPLLAFQFGVSTRQIVDGVIYEFTDNLGPDGERLVEVLFTDRLGMSVDPLRLNRLIASTDTVAGIVRGSATQPFEGGDFFAFDLNPGAGGSGFVVGYVSDLDSSVDEIPATAGGVPGNCPTNELLVVQLRVGPCPNYALYFGQQATTETVNAAGMRSFSISSRNADPLFGFQFGVSTATAGGITTYSFADNLGPDAERLVESLMTNSMGDSIRPETPNRLTSDTDQVVSIVRGAALNPLADGDFLTFDLNPGVGGPGFFVGYVSDVDGSREIPATPPGDEQSCPLNELLQVQLTPTECPSDFSFLFGDTGGVNPVNAQGATSFAISSRNSRPLFGFQLGVRITPSGNDFTYEFSEQLGADAERLVELIMTDTLGVSVDAVGANTLITNTDQIAAVERGSAIQGLDPGDFFAFDLNPGVGGNGFVVGYVSDLDGSREIPATPGDAEECRLNELLRVRLGERPCPEFAFYFGGEATTETVDARGQQSFSIHTRNVRPLLAFSLGVSFTDEGALTRLRFSDTVGTDAERIIELLMTDNLGASVVPETPNDLIADSPQVSAIRRGAAIAGFDPGDFLAFDLNPAVGGPGFFVGYVSDLDGSVNEIPATPPGEECPLNEVLIVELGEERPFTRGDVNADTKVNITDAVILLQQVVGNPIDDPVNCDDAFDADDDEDVDVADGLAILNWMFLEGDPLPQPFFVGLALQCNLDPTPGALGCLESNCAGRVLLGISHVED